MYIVFVYTLIVSPFLILSLLNFYSDNTHLIGHFHELDTYIHDPYDEPEYESQNYLVMEEIENEFKSYLNELISRVPKPETDTHYEPGAFKYGHYTREFNREASKKLDELFIQVRDQPEEKARLTHILEEYRTKLMTGNFQ